MPEDLDSLFIIGIEDHQSYNGMHHELIVLFVKTLILLARISLASKGFIERWYSYIDPVPAHAALSSGVFS